MNQSRLGEFFAPLVHSLELTNSSKASPLDMLEEEIANEQSGSGNSLSKHTIQAIQATANAPLGSTKKNKPNDVIKPTRRGSSSSLVIKEEKEKQRPKTCSLGRSISSLTLLGSKKPFGKEKENSSIRVRSASTVQLSEVKPYSAINMLSIFQYLNKTR